MRVPLLRNVVIGAALLAGSYLAAGLVNAPTMVQPRITSTHRPGTVIVVAPPAETTEPAASTVPADNPHGPVDPLRAL